LGQRLTLGDNAFNFLAFVHGNAYGLLGREVLQNIIVLPGSQKAGF